MVREEKRRVWQAATRPQVRVEIQHDQDIKMLSIALLQIFPPENKKI